MIMTSSPTRRIRTCSAWAMPMSLRRSSAMGLGLSSSFVSSRRRSSQAVHSYQTRCSTATKPALSADELTVAEATARVTHYVSQGDLSSIGTFELLAFCNVKGLTATANIWDRPTLEAAVREYAGQERLARLQKGSEWEEMSAARKIRLLHDVCNGEGDVTYIDPGSGYCVFSYFAHLKRGNCCGIKQRDEKGEDGKLYERTHRCRHCPYTEPGDLKSAKMKALMDRVAVIEFARERAQQIWAEEGVASTGVTFGTLGEQKSSSQGGQGAKAASLPLPDKRTEITHKQRFAKVVQIEKPKDKPCSCEDCADEKVVTCTRCNGFTYLFSPELMKCPQCETKGYHPCMSCTPFRPPSKSSFYS